MAAQICETCDYRYEECSGSSNSTCKDYKIDPRILDKINKYNKNLERIEALKTFMGGDNADVPINCKSIEDMRFIVQACKECGIPQPDVFPWAGGDGVQAEWEYDWYLEIDSWHKSISILFVKGKDYDNAISTNVSNIKTAFLLVREFLNYVVDMKGTR